MKLFSLLIFSLLSHMAISSDFELSELSLNGHSLLLTQSEIESEYGKGDRVKPDYECGFYADDQPGAPYFQLVYKDFTFIGSIKEKFILEEFNISKDSPGSLSYKGVSLTSSISKKEFSNIFGTYSKEYFKESPNKDFILLFFNKADDGVVFKFKNNKLASYQYWSPC